MRRVERQWGKRVQLCSAVVRSYEEGARRARSAKHKGDGQRRTVYKAAQQSQLKQASVTRVLLADAGGVEVVRSLLLSYSGASCRLATP